MGLIRDDEMRSTLKTRSLSDSFGREILELDLRRGAGSQLARHLAGLLYRHAVICIRNQDLSPAELAEFGQSFGTLIEHTEEDLRLPGLPGVMTLSNADDRDDRQLNGGAHWHTPRPQR